MVVNGLLMGVGQVISVSCVWEENTHLAEQRCSCGGNYRSLRWELDFEKECQLEVVHAKCNSCGIARRFWFDVTAAFQPHAQNYIKQAWPAPRDGPYLIDEKGYREAAVQPSSQLDAGVSS